MWPNVHPYVSSGILMGTFSRGATLQIMKMGSTGDTARFRHARVRYYCCFFNFSLFLSQPCSSMPSGPYQVTNWFQMFMCINSFYRHVHSYYQNGSNYHPPTHPPFMPRLSCQLSVSVYVVVPFVCVFISFHFD